MSISGNGTQSVGSYRQRRWGDPAKVKAIQEFPEPTLSVSHAKKLKHVQSFVGMCNFFRRMVPNFAIIAEPLTKLTKKNTEFVWGPAQRESFEALKKALVDSATNAFPRYDLLMHLYTDACGYGVVGF